MNKGGAMIFKWVGIFLVACGVLVAAEEAEAPKKDDKAAELQKILGMMAESQKKPVSEEEKIRKEISKLRKEVELIEAKHNLESAKESLDEKNLALLKYNLTTYLEEAIRSIKLEEVVLPPQYTFVAVGDDKQVYLSQNLLNTVSQELMEKKALLEKMRHAKSRLDIDYRMDSESIKKTQSLLRDIDMVLSGESANQRRSVNNRGEDTSVLISSKACYAQVCVRDVDRNQLILAAENR